ncbi:MAG: hypothetical protein ACKVT0_20085, partial [Planctomycetaceae bacterium]
SAMACKYPGVVSVVIPIAAFIIGSAVLACRRQRREGNDASRFRMSDLWNRNVIQVKAWFGIGVLLAIGPWLAKNVAETGNPVYPLLYSVFGGVDLDAELNEKWKRGHSPSTYALSDLAEKFVDVTLKSDWLSPLLFGLAPLALLVRRRRVLSQFLLVYVAYLFLTWWLLTHRIDRFWVPLIPVVSLLAGVGITWSCDKLWIRAAGLAVTLAVAFNLGFITTGLCGYNAYLLDLNIARVQAARITSPELVLLNNLEIPKDQTVLIIGDAEVFDADFPIIYHTVFDRPILDDWWGIPQAEVTRDLWPQREPRDIQDELHARKIRYVYVNWMEVLRYRMTYSYTDYVRPERFRVLQRAGVLGANLPLNQAYAQWKSFRPEEQQEIEEWAPELIVTLDGEKYFIASEIFPVR